MARVLVVDDEAGLRDTMARFLAKDGHEVRMASCAANAIQALHDGPADVVVTDIIMPGMDGVNLLTEIHRVDPAVKVILVTGEPTVETASAALRGGAFEYLSKPLTKDRLLIAVSAAMRVKTLEEENERYRLRLEALVEERTEELEHSYVRIFQVLMDTAQALASAMELRDPYTAGHQRRVTRLATDIAKHMGMDANRVEGLRVAGLLHDLGKLYVPSEILAKPAKLSSVEMALLKVHPQAGHDLIAHVDFPWPVAEIVLQHHERLDGSGYPRGLSGDAILPEARILAVADVVEAMVSHRPYRPALTLQAAVEELSVHSGIKYDSDVVAAALDMAEKGTLIVETAS